MQQLNRRGFTLRHLDPFQPGASGARSFFGDCGNPGSAFATRLRLITFLRKGWKL